MIYELSTDQIANRLINDTKPLEMLTKNDSEYISCYARLLEWTKKDALNKMPVQIQFNSHVSQAKVQKVQGVFTSMLGMVNGKAYQYETSDADTMSKIFAHYTSGLKINSQPQAEDDFQEKQEAGEQMVRDPNMEQQMGRSQSKGSSRPDMQMGMAKKAFAPFVANAENPYDRHANSKLIRNQRVPFDGKMRNIAALIQKNRRVNHFKTQSSGMRAASQSKKNGQLDVTDVLKYTLGEKRQREIGYKPQPFRNPFVRVPPKYSQSLNDFYMNK